MHDAIQGISSEETSPQLQGWYKTIGHMMKEKTLGTERERENIYLTLYPCSGFDSMQDRTCLGDINSMWKYSLSFAFVAMEVQDSAV